MSARTSRRRRIAWILLANASIASIASMASITSIASSARADDETKARCASAYEQAQRSRKSGQLLASKELLLACTNPACSEFVRTDCDAWLAEVSRAMPTVVFSARTPSGADVLDVRVSIDGAPVMERLDGKAREVDPGEHLFVFEHAGSPTVEQRVLLKEGDKLRPISVTLTGAPEPLENKPSRAVPTSVYVFSVLGVVGLSGFAYFGASGLSQRHTLDACTPRCAPEDVDAAKRTFLFADASLGVGMVSLAIASVLFATAESKDAQLAIAPITGGLAASLGGSF